MSAPHQCSVLGTVPPPVSSNMIVDGFRRALSDFMSGYGSFYDWWRERDPAMDQALRFCPLCGERVRQ